MEFISQEQTYAVRQIGLYSPYCQENNRLGYILISLTSDCGETSDAGHHEEVSKGPRCSLSHWDDTSKVLASRVAAC